MEKHRLIQSRARRANLARARNLATDIVRRKARSQPDPIRFHQGGPGAFPIKHLDAETRALIDAALAAQPKAGRRAPA